MVENILEIKNLNVIYKTKSSFLSEPKTVNAVNDVTLEVKKGEILAIAGESGCGKSTLAKAIMKLVEAQSGEILLENKNILNLKKREELKGLEAGLFCRHMEQQSRQLAQLEENIGNVRKELEEHSRNFEQTREEYEKKYLNYQ